MKKSTIGFTLIELIVVIFILLSVIASLIQIMRGSFSVILKEDDRLEIQQNIRYALDYISKYLAEANEINYYSEKELEFQLNFPFWDNNNDNVCIEKIRFHCGESSARKAILMNIKKKCRGDRDFKTVQENQPIAFISNISKFNEDAYLKFDLIGKKKGIKITIRGVMRKPPGKTVTISTSIYPVLLQE